MKKIFILIMLMPLFFFNNNAKAQGHEIKLIFKSLPNDTIILGYHYNSKLIPSDTVVTDKRGNAVIKGDTLLMGGMYFLFLSNKSYFDFLIDKDQKFTITGDSTDFLNTVKYTGSEQNSIFIKYQNFLSGITLKQDSLKKEYEKYKEDEKKQKEIIAEFEKLNEERTAQFNATIEDNPNMFFSVFLKASRQVVVPKTITKPMDKYIYNRMHYFDDFNVGDERLLHTPIYESKIDVFMDKILPQYPDTLIAEVDKLIEKSRTSDALFKYMLIHLFNKYASSQYMSSENVYVHIAEKYYIPEAKWSSKEFIDELKEKVITKKYCLVGGIAKDINFKELPSDTTVINKYMAEIPKYKQDGIDLEKSKIEEDLKIKKKIELLKQFSNGFKTTNNLYSVDAEYIILWFWTPDCSHCRKETPEFYELYEQKKLAEKGVKVISMFMSKDISGWARHSKILNDWLIFIKKHKMNNWINVWNPFDGFRTNYDIQSSPIIYLLNKDKEIIAKKVTYQQAIEIIEKDIEMNKIQD